MARLRMRWPVAVIPTVRPSSTARPTPGANYAPAVGRLSKPVERIPRWRQEVLAAYIGVPTRAGITMPAVPARPRGKNGWWGWPRRFGIDLPHGGDPNTPTGPNAFGVPAMGNLYLRPHYNPAPPVIGYLAGRPFPGRAGLVQMSPPRRLGALLPNPDNLYAPPRYGQPAQPGSPSAPPAMPPPRGRRS